jgi:2,4-dienoyl-CoA reductase-like NADH-dependent reductase (Old Yellow Enzyme family)
MNNPFDPLRIGPVILRNRFIRSAAFEGMSAGHTVTPELIAYHSAVAEGGVGMSTVAYAAVSKSGLSFAHQLWLRKEMIPDLKKLTMAIKSHGAKASIQIGHTGNMSHAGVTGMRPIAPSGRLNLYGPTWPRQMDRADIDQVISDFRQAVLIAKESGFDAVEIHAGHGYLISQFLSPYTNHRKDDYGRSFQNRSRFLREVLLACRNAAGPDMAMLVKMNMSDGFKEGISKEEALATARIIEDGGADAIVLSGGFVSKSPLYIMRGEITPRIMAYHMKGLLIKSFVRLFGYQLMKPLPFTEGYFLEDARHFREVVKIPLVVVGGLNSLPTIQKALDLGFEGIGLARALIQNPRFVNELRDGLLQKSGCTVCNYCVAVMYSGQMRCFMDDPTAPDELIRVAEKIHYAS